MNKKIAVLFLFCTLVLGAMPAFAATSALKDSSQMDLSAINAVQGSIVTQIGTVIIWGAAANPYDADKWLECNGQSTAGYPELAAIVGSNVPNYKDQFLRGSGAGQVGQVAADSMSELAPKIRTGMLACPSGGNTYVREKKTLGSFQGQGGADRVNKR